MSSGKEKPSNTNNRPASIWFKSAEAICGAAAPAARAISNVALPVRVSANNLTFIAKDSPRVINFTFKSSNQSGGSACRTSSGTSSVNFFFLLKSQLKKFIVEAFRELVRPSWLELVTRSSGVGLEMTLARIGRGDDRADRFLVETLETAVALQVFQVAADGALLREFIELLAGDEIG